MRKLPYVTAGLILQKLKERGLSISRVTFYELQKRNVFESQKSSGGWRVYTPSEAAAVTRAILEDRRLREPNDMPEELQQLKKEYEEAIGLIRIKGGETNE